MNDYFEEFYTLNTEVNLQEIDVHLVSRYTNGLKEQIKDEISLYVIKNFNLALKLELKHNKQAH